MELYLTTYGSLLHKNAEMFEIQSEGEKKKISPQKVSSIIICTGVRLTSDAVKLALDFNIDILFLDEFGEPYGRIWFPKLGSTTYIRRRLLEISLNEEGVDFVKGWVSKKIQNQAALIAKLASKRDKFDFSEKVQSIRNYAEKVIALTGSLDEVGGTLMGYEGNAGRLYFEMLSMLLPEKYQFNGRSSQPAKDVFNACLNYGYGILYGKVEKALIIAGLDPYIGLLHKDNYNKVSLVYDFIEPYRKFIEETVFYLFTRHKMNEDHFEDVPNGVKLNDLGKKVLVPELMAFFDEIVRHHNKNMKRIQTIQADAHAFANFLIGKREDY